MLLIKPLLEGRNLKYLEQYLGKGYYLHFSDIEKIGINPKSDFSTPLGVYSYPINEQILRFFVSDNCKHSTFGADRKFINIFRPKSGLNLLYTSKDISNQEYDSYIDRLYKLLETKMMGENGVPQEFELIFDNMENFVSNSFYIKDRAKNVSSLWVSTYYLSNADRVAGHYLWRETSSTRRWNYILRAIGIDGIVDDAGLGVIHKAEPIQAVFFGGHQLQFIESIPNFCIKKEKPLSKKLIAGSKISIIKIAQIIQDIISRTEVKDGRIMSEFVSGLAKFVDLLKIESKLVKKENISILNLSLFGGKENSLLYENGNLKVSFPKPDEKNIPNDFDFTCLNKEYDIRKQGNFIVLSIPLYKTTIEIRNYPASLNISTEHKNTNREIYKEENNKIFTIKEKFSDQIQFYFYNKETLFPVVMQAKINTGELLKTWENKGYSSYKEMFFDNFPKTEAKYWTDLFDEKYFFRKLLPTNFPQDKPKETIPSSGDIEF